MARRLLQIDVTDDEVDLVSDVLWGIGVDGIEERDSPDGVTLVTEATDALIEAVDGRWRYEIVDIDLAESLDGWRRWATATVLDAGAVHGTETDGRPVVLRAPWVPPPVADALEVVIDPGHAWGHGGHPSTRGAAELLVRCSSRDDFSSAAVLDVGCGSGVLGVLAARLGAGRVVATDIDPAALEATPANASGNGVVIDVVPALPSGRFDVVVANIDAVVLVDLVAALHTRLNPGGWLILSGMLERAVEQVRSRCLTLVEVDRWTDGEWVALTLSP